MNTETSKTVIEINGVKMEVDLRHARRIENIAVGSRVKVLRKKYSGYEVLQGIVIGFEPFKELPTIIIAVANIDYSKAEIEFIYYNAKTEETEVVVSSDDDMAALDKNDFVAKVDRDIAKKENEIAELNDRKNYFLSKFKAYWEPMERATAEAHS
jgi:hypothetical protein